MAALVVRSDDPASSLLLQGGGGRNGGRSRKNKNGPKKQPQRGLGVAQLEKLRLQEESKQESACLASLGFLPLVPLASNSSASSCAFGAFDDGHGEICLPFVHGHGFPQPMKSIVGYAGGGYRSNGIASLSPGGSPGTGYPNGGFPSSRGCEDHLSSSSSPLAILFQQQQQQHKVLGIHTSGTRSGCGPSNTPCSTAMVVLPPLPVPEKTGGTTTKVFIGGNGSGGNGGGGGAVSLRGACSPTSTEEVAVKLQHRKGGEQHFGVNCVQLFDASLPPGALPMPPRDSSRELSMVGIPKELSSFQTNFPGNQVWPTASMHNASPPLEKRPCVVISLDHGEIHSKSSQSETADNILKGGAHYTPRSISNALGKSSLPFLKADATTIKPSLPGFDNGVKSDHPTDSTSSVSSMPFLRKRVAAACYLDDSPSCPAAKKARVSSGADFLALSLSISHSDRELSSRPLICSDDTTQQQRSSLSLQETLTDVEEGSSSQKSPSSYGNSSTDVSTIEVEHSVTLSHQLDHHNHHRHDRRRRSNSSSSSSSGSGSRNEVDLNLKLAI